MRGSDLTGKTRRLAAALLLAALAAPAGAQQVNDPQRTAQALARAQGLLKQIGQQKQMLEVENAKAQAKLANVEQRLKRAEYELEELRSDLDASERSNERANTSLERTRERLAATTDKLRDVIAQYKETALELRRTQYEKEQVESELAATEAELADAEARNLELYADNREILALYRNKSGWSALLQSEPVTGLKKVEVENVVEKYEYEMYDHLREANLEAAQALKREMPLSE